MYSNCDHKLEYELICELNIVIQLYYFLIIINFPITAHYNMEGVTIRQVNLIGIIVLVVMNSYSHLRPLPSL